MRVSHRVIVNAFVLLLTVSAIVALLSVQSNLHAALIRITLIENKLKYQDLGFVNADYRLYNDKRETS